VVVKYNGFVTFFVNLFRFLGQPTDRNFGPNCMLNGSKVVFQLINVPFGVCCLQIYYEGVYGPKNRQIVNRKKFGIHRFLAKIALTLEPLEVDDP